MKQIKGCYFINGDIRDKNIQDEIIKYLNNRHFTTVLCDMSPPHTGNHNIDHIQQLELAYIGLEISLKYLKKNGSYLTKVFQGSLIKEFENELKNHFENVEYIKPQSSRKESSEIYILSSKIKC